MTLTSTIWRGAVAFAAAASLTLAGASIAQAQEGSFFGSIFLRMK